MRHWFKDRHFKSLLKNSGYLAVSRAVAGVAGLATVVFAGRGLGLVLFGTLILITSYAKAAAGLSKFQSWQLVVRYSGDIHKGGDATLFKQATSFAMGLDIVSGFAGMAIAIALLPFLADKVGIEAAFLTPALLYCLLLPTMGAATPIGVLRALDRFDLLSWQGTSYPIARAILCGIAFAYGAGFETFLAIYFITDMGGDLYLWFLAWRELKRRGLTEGIRPKLRPGGLPGAWRFAIHANVNASLITAWGPIARLAVGGLLGASGAALFRIASSLADSAQKPADMLAKAFYPEVVRMDLATKKPWNLMIRGTALATAVALVAVLLLLAGGEPLIRLLFGKEFLPAFPVLLVLMFVPLIGMLSFPLPPMLFALDRPDAPVTARLVGTACFFLIVAPLSWTYGVQGAAAAYVTGHAVMTLTLGAILWREYRRVRTA